MTDHITAMQQALEALEFSAELNTHHRLMTGEELKRACAAITSLRAALAQQQAPQKERPDFLSGYDAGLADGHRDWGKFRDQQQGEPWGWAIVDKDGNAAVMRARHVRFFGDPCFLNDPLGAENAAYQDRENPGLAPHRIVTLYTEPAAPAGATAGWVLVPVEPTEEMLRAADDGDDAYTLRSFGPGVQRVMQGPYDHWHAMLAARPAHVPESGCGNIQTAAAKREPLTPDAMADRCEAWLQSGGASNVVDAYEAGFRDGERAHGIGGEA